MKFERRHVSSISARNPFEIYFLAFLAVATIPVAFGRVPTPGSLDALLDPSIRRLWAVMLSGGAILALVGVAWPRPRLALVGKVSTTGIILEQIGLAAVSGGCIIYAGALGYLMVDSQRLDGLVSFGLVSALAAACWRRYFMLQRQLREEEHLGGDAPQITGG